MEGELSTGTHKHPRNRRPLAGEGIPLSHCQKAGYSSETGG
jgi:hypothetical protein